MGKWAEINTMIFAMTDAEIISALQEAVRQDDGFLAVRMPVKRLLGNEMRRPNLTFSDSIRTVHSGRLSVRLSPTQYAMLKHVHDNGRTTYESLQDAVWNGRQTSDGAIRASLSRVNAKLMDGGFGIELTHHNGKVSLESTS